MTRREAGRWPEAERSGAPVLPESEAAGTGMGRGAGPDPGGVERGEGPR